MPSQSNPYPDVVYYAEGDTAPNLRVQLVDGAGVPIDLTGCIVAIDVAFSTWSFYYAPHKALIVSDTCVVDPDQVANTGYVDWVPHDLTPAGNFSYTFSVTYPGGGVQTIPANRYLKLIVKSPVPSNLS